MADSVTEWYKGRNVFCTGGTGFMGKVLLEKLLRSCPGIGKIYLLSRPKKGLTTASRIAEFSKLPVFEKLLAEDPGALKKIAYIEGDIVKEGIGISEEDRETLANEVSVVFHLGATVKLESGLKNSVNINTVGTLKMLELARTFKKLEAFVHVSTTFCHCTLKVLEEKIYPSPYNPRDIMQAVGWMTDEQAAAILPLLIQDFPNSYSFSKRLAETLVEEFSEWLPVTVVRPSIVIPSLYEPIPGWVDSYNGPIGIMAAAGKGVVRSMLGRPENNFEAIPVDVTSNAFILAAWATAKNRPVKGEVPVYNVSSSDMIPITWAELVEKCKKTATVYPLEAGLWYPGGDFTPNPYKHAFFVFFLQLLPAYIIDFFLRSFGHKPFLVVLQTRIHAGMKLMYYFTQRRWDFRTERMKGLVGSLNEAEQKMFYFLKKDEDLDKYLLNAMLGCRTYLLKEPMSSIPKARRQQKLLYVLDVSTKVLLTGFLLWLAGCLLNRLFLTT